MFEFRPGEVCRGAARSARRKDLANLISTELEGAKRTVAYVPEPLRGYAVLAAPGLREIVMGPDASLGPITPEGQPVDPGNPRAGPVPRDPQGVRPRAAPRHARPPRRPARGPDGRQAAPLRHGRRNLPEFARTHQVDRGRAGLGGGPARRPDGQAGPRGGVRQADRRQPVRGRQRLPARRPCGDQRPDARPGLEAGLDPDRGADRHGQEVVPDPADRAGPAGEGQPRLLPDQQRGGLDTAADAIADTIAGIKDMKTVAFIDDRATGRRRPWSPWRATTSSSARGRRWATSASSSPAGNGQVQELTERQVKSLTTRAADLAEQKGHPVAVARAMVDPDAVVVEAKDAKTGAVGVRAPEPGRGRPGRYLDPQVRKERRRRS